MYASRLARMEEDLQLLGLSERTKETYLYRAKKIIEYFNKPPEQITDDELREYFLYLKNDKKYARATQTIALCGIKFLFEKALKYLAQYVFRIAISNSRILSLKNGVVSFKYKESKTEQWKIMSLKAEEFIRRFLQHVLPSGFVKVRYYGLFASANRKLLAKVRESLGCKKLETKKKAKPKKAFKCKDCKKEMIIVSVMPRYVVLYNKAPPIMNSVVRNINPKRSA